MISTHFNDWKIRLLGCIVACLVQRLPAWHSGYVLGVLKYKYHPFLPTISFSPPQGIAYYKHTVHQPSFRQPLLSTHFAKPPFHLPYHTTPHIIHTTMATTLSSTPCSVEVSTTQPVHQNLPRFSSERLFFRSLFESDFEAYHLLVKQPEPMRGYGLDAMPETNTARHWFNALQDNTRVGIFLKNSDEREGELIGEGLVLKMDKQWPRVHYVFKKEYWGHGYATEFLKAFLSVWWDLPRENTSILVEEISLDSQEKHKATERLCAEIKMDNKANQKVVEKAGFKFCGEVQNQDKEICAFWRIICPKKEETVSGC